MRTDVKVGLICAVVVVLCVLLYFVTHSTPRPSTATTQSRGTTSARIPTPATSPATAPSTALTGGFIGLPGSTIATTAPATSPALATTAGLATTPTTPDVVATPALTSTGTGLTGTATPSLSTPSVGTSGLGTTSTGGTTSGATLGGLTSSGADSSAAGLPVTSVAGSTALRGTLQVMPSDTTSTFSGLTSTSAATTHKIQKGDMFGTIARKFNVTIKALEAANPGVDSNHLKIDAIIKIPAPTVTASRTTAAPGDSTRATAVASTPRTTAGTSTPAASTIKPGSTYTVKKGDTLRTIAKAAYGSKSDGWKKIFQANRSELNDPDMVPVGAKIVIPQ